MSKFIHVSTGPKHRKGLGMTYNVGRNAAKRERATFKGPAKTPKGNK